MFNLKSWSNEFFKLATEPMTPRQSEIFLNMIMLGNQEVDIPELKSSFMYQVLDKRAQYMGLTMSDPAKVFLMFIMESPGTAVMYLSALRSRVTHVDMGVLAEQFPMGFLSAKSLEKMWDDQKGHAHQMKVDNCLDSCDFNAAPAM